ncbi:GumC family protein [bacterium]|nr:GumC family protein [candidate division CSSED10-310 bacterium]
MNTRDGFSIDYEIPLKFYWYSIRRHIRLVFFCILFCVSLAAIHLYTKPDLYRSSTQILIENQGQIIGTGPGYFRMPQPIDSEIIEHYIMSSSVMEKIRDMIGKDIRVSSGDFTVDFPNMEDNRGYRTQCLVEISSLSGNPEHSYLMIQAIVKAFRAQMMENKLQQSRETLIWMTEQLAEQKEKVEVAEENFQNYKQEIMVLSFEEQQAEESRRIINATTELSSVESARLQLQVELDRLQQAQAQGPPVSDIAFQSQGIESVTELMNQYNSARADLTENLKIFKGKHPKIVEITEQIDNLRTRIESEKTHTISAMSMRLRTLNDQVFMLKKSIENYKKNAQDIAQKELQYRILEREVKTNSELYNSLLEELKKTDLKGKIESTSITVIEPPRVPGSPVSKQTPRNIFMALIVGAVLGCGFAILLDYIEPTFRTPEDVERLVGIPVVGMIPEKE